MKLDRAKETSMNRLGWGVGELEGRQWERHLLHLGWVVLVKVSPLHIQYMFKPICVLTNDLH